MAFIVTTAVVLKLLKSRAVRLEQLRNMLDISVTEEVSVVPAVKLVMFEQPLNALFNLVQPTIPRLSTDLTLSLSPPLLK